MQPKKRHVIHEVKDLLPLLKHPNQIYILLQCEIRIGINLYEIILENPVEGIEIIPGFDNKKDTGMVAARISPGLHITNLRFKRTFGIVDCLINGPVRFDNVIFEEAFQFQHNELKADLSFNNITVQGTASFNSLFAHSKFTISNSILPLMKLGFMNSLFEEDVFLFDSYFQNGLDLSKCRFKKRLEISHGDIAGLLNISDSKVGNFVLTGAYNGEKLINVNNINLSDTVFQDQVQLYCIDLSGSITGTRAVFQKELYLTRSIFHGQVQFTALTASGIVIIEYCQFDHNFSLAHGLIEKVVSIKHTTYKGDLLFTGATINDNIWIGTSLHAENAVNFNGTISFAASSISANSIVRIFHINTSGMIQGKLHMQNALVKGLLDIRKVYLEEVSFDGTVVTGNVQDNGTLAPFIKDWHSARLLKHEAKKINDNISSLVYYRREMELHAKGLQLRQTGDWLLFKLNAWSNRYGTSWLTGILFTIVTGFISYYLFTFSAHNFRFIIPDWAGFFQYIWLPNGIDGLINQDRSINGGFIGALFFLLGKILIAYGIYQTITAFRKYL